MRHRVSGDAHHRRAGDAEVGVTHRSTSGCEQHQAAGDRHRLGGAASQAYQVSQLATMPKSPTVTELTNASSVVAPKPDAQEGRHPVALEQRDHRDGRARYHVDHEELSDPALITHAVEP